MQKRVAVSVNKLAYIFSQLMMLVPRYAFRSVSVFFDFMICNFAVGDLAWVGTFYKMLKVGYKLKNHAGYKVIIAVVSFLLSSAEEQLYRTNEHGQNRTQIWIPQAFPLYRRHVSFARADISRSVRLDQYLQGSPHVNRTQPVRIGKIATDNGRRFLYSTF